MYSSLSFYKIKEVRTIFLEFFRLFKISENNLEISFGGIINSNLSNNNYED